MTNVTSWVTLASAIEVTGFDAAWTNETLARVFDLSEAFSDPVGLLIDPQTNLLRIEGPGNWGGSLPTSFVLRGIEVEVRGQWTGDLGGVRTIPVDAMVGSAVRQALGTGSLPIGAPGSFIMGGPTNKMGMTEADVVAAGFGFQLRGASTTFDVGGNVLRIDSVRPRLYWDAPALPRKGRGRARSVLVQGAVL